MMSILLLFLLISSGSFYATVRFGKKYEQTVPFTIFCAVELVFIFGLFDQLRLGVWVLCAVALALYALGIRHLIVKREVRPMLSRLFTPAFFIFAGLLAVYLFVILGRVAWGSDEFSFWATSVKKMFYLDTFHCLPAAEPYFGEYPPGMQIFQFIFQVLNGEFSEWRISFSYMTYVFALFLPFLVGLKHKSVLKNLLIFAVIFSCSTIIIPDSLDNLMVDFALGATFAYGMSRLFLLQRNAGKWSRFEIINIVLAANMLILIKSAGKLFAALILIALLFVLIKTKIQEKLPAVKGDRKLNLLWYGVLLIPIVTALLWKMKYTYYRAPIVFDSNSYDIKELLLVLLGGGQGYRVEIKANFIGFLLNEKVNIGFLSLTNIQLAVIVIALIGLVGIFYRKQSGVAKKTAIFLLTAGLFIYWLGLLASYMYTFSQSEGVALASMQRYLNIYFVGLLYFIILLMLNGHTAFKCDDGKFCVALLLILSLTNHQELLNLASRSTVHNSQALRAPFQMLVDQIQGDTQPPTKEKPTTLLIYRTGYPHWPVNHFTYLLWPNYQVPWECSYGEEGLFDGDTYTQNFSSSEFQAHVATLGVDYIAIGYLDEDFIELYGDLFDAPLENGQVYKISDPESKYALMAAPGE